MSFAELTSQAMRLRPAQRAKLVNVLIQTLDKHEEPRLTLEELDRRSEELSSGRVQGIPAGEMIAAAKSKLRR
jgi:hypothetical protein